MNVTRPPFNPDQVYQQALTFHHAGKLNEAEKLYHQLLSYFPNEVGVLSPLGTLLLQLEKHNEGVAVLKQSLKIHPQQPDVFYNLGVELQKHTKLEEALDVYNQALKLNPNDINTLLNSGNTLKDLKRFDEAIVQYDQAVKLEPKLAAAYWNKSLIKILKGEYEEGWRLYEWGWQAGERKSTHQFGQPTWLGEQSLNGKTIPIFQEQGLGDFIQFCRYIPLLETMGANVLVDAPIALRSILSTLNANVGFIEEGYDQVSVDMICPVMSLPFAFKTTLESIPSQAPYLFANQNKKIEWKKRLGNKIKPRIGIVWSGSMTNKIDLNPLSRRNIPLDQLKPIFELPLEFHALQKEFRPEDLVALEKINNLQVHEQNLNDFSDTAALIEEMDLVISVCTSVAHLSGAMDHPTWVLLPYSPDYRWMLDRSDSPWYPSIRLFRQAEIKDWSQIIDQVTKSLLEKFYKH